MNNFLFSHLGQRITIFTMHKFRIQNIKLLFLTPAESTTKHIGLTLNFRNCLIFQSNTEICQDFSGFSDSFNLNQIKFYKQIISDISLIIIHMTENITLAYWGIRGLGQVPRLLLAYSGLSWNNKLYTTREAWFDEDKKNLGLHFPNLPYLIDGDFKVTESRAIALYIIKKSGKNELLGKTIQDEALVESIIGVITDLRHALIPLVFDPTWKDKIGGVIGKGTPKLAELQKFYGDREFALGYLSYADFVISEFSYYIEHITPELYTQHPFLKRAREAVEGLPEIKAFYGSDKATKGPFFPPSAAIQF